MTEQARIYGAVLFELDIPQEMVEQAAGAAAGESAITEGLEQSCGKTGKEASYIGEDLSGTGLCSAIASFSDEGRGRGLYRTDAGHSVSQSAASV